jgi:hypothetical protein
MYKYFDISPQDAVSEMCRIFLASLLRPAPPPLQKKKEKFQVNLHPFNQWGKLQQSHYFELSTSLTN